MIEEMGNQERHALKFLYHKREKLPIVDQIIQQWAIMKGIQMKFSNIGDIKFLILGIK